MAMDKCKGFEKRDFRDMKHGCQYSNYYGHS
jgi:hypothetical protein